MAGGFKSLLCTVFTLMTLIISAQGDDPILFSVEDMNVPVSEFRYIYEKNNRNDADYSQASVQEYLDLYIKFKLKVKRAYDLQLDTIKALQDELAGYRKQLAKSYLSDKEVTERLAREAYERMKSDLLISHILFKITADASEEDVARVHDKAMRAFQRIQAGEDFEALVSELSEDANTKSHGGEIGYVSAMLPNGFYAMENAIYNLKEGEISEPVRTTLGYHIIRLDKIRPARGQVEASHILVRVKEDGSNEAMARQKVDMIYNNITNGSEFETLARSLSDDTRTAKRGGYIGTVGINMFDPVFEDAVFSIPQDGGISEPVRTRLGWHIIKRLKKVRVGTFDEEFRKLEAKLSRSERIEIAKEAMIRNIKAESGLTEDTVVRDALISDLGADFLTFQWQVPSLAEEDLLTFNDGTAISNVEFARFMRTNTRTRMQAQHSAEPADVAMQLYDDFVNEQCIAFEERQLDEKYPEFAALMREYQEGILLFEVTKMQVWDKANSDTAGLIAYHEGHIEDYMWPERAQVVHYTIKGENAKVAAKVRRLATKKSPEQVVRKFNKTGSVVTFQKKMYTQDEMEAAGLQWIEGLMSNLTTADEMASSFNYVEKLLPATPKKLSEARGYIIADYQDALEKEWVAGLRDRYRVKVYAEPLASMVR